MLNMIKNAIPRKALSFCAAGLLFGASSLSATAGDFVFDMVNTGSTPIDVQVTVSQWDNETIRFTLDQNNPNAFGDLRGLLFHVNENVINLNDLDISFVSAVQNMTGDAKTFDITPTFNLNGSSMNGLSNYDIAVEFGHNGIGGGDDIKSITFDLATTAIGGSLDLDTFFPANMEQFMAVRATSAFDGNDREGSSKLTTNCCGTTVPEPSSMAGLMVLAFGGLLWRRKFSA
ncbi:PEP-CTERM sorting domain-containing protein [Paremcibacter congregatus]|uniref:PEP-CTERM sorting domain-containing protein n=1 Tax=Paremcibacter congregatus TaxID=2043170 RepID=UPI003A8D9C4F